MDENMTTGERIKYLRQVLKIPQVKFAKAIYISSGYIAELETGHRKINERIIRLISLTYGVNEKWLRTGEGEIFFGAGSEKQQRMIELFNELPPEFQDQVMMQIEQLLNVSAD